jgi:periplasmic divalent cation tolerance protein
LYPIAIEKYKTVVPHLSQKYKRRSMPEYPVIVATTWPADRDPAPFALALVEARLAACVNVLGEMQSTYRWAGQVETATERQLVIKTVAGRVPELEARLRALHPYEIPEFLVIPTSGGSDAYVAWLREMTD